MLFIIGIISFLVQIVFGGSGFIPTVTYQGNACQGNPLRAFAAGGTTDLQKWQNCSSYLANTPALSNIVDKCETVQNSNGQFSRKIMCLDSSDYITCFPNMSSPTYYASYGFYTNAACTLQDSTASLYVGTVALINGSCTPFDFSKPNEPPFISANCKPGAESFRMWQDANCQTSLPGTVPQGLNGSCVSFPFVNGLYVRGFCSACPQPSPSPSPSPPSTNDAGLSAGAIAGIVIGSLAALAILGGLAWWYTRRQQASNTTVKDYPLEKTQEKMAIQNSNLPVASNLPIQPVVESAALAAVPLIPPQYQTMDSVQPVQTVTVREVGANGVVKETTTVSMVPVTTTASSLPRTIQPSITSVQTTVQQPNVINQTIDTGRANVDFGATNRFQGVTLTCIRTFVPESHDEIVLNKDDQVTIQQIFDDGWVFGTNLTTKATGLFPMAVCAKL